jgi:hypothetical protein
MSHGHGLAGGSQAMPALWKIKKDYIEKIDASPKRSEGDKAKP